MGKEGKRQKMIQIPSDSFANSQMSFFVIVQTLLFSPDEYYFDIFQTAGIISPFPRFSKVVFCGFCRPAASCPAGLSQLLTRGRDKVKRQIYRSPKMLPDRD